MYSATMAPEIRQLANDILRDPVPILIGGPQRPAIGIVQSVYPVAQDRKTALLTTLIKLQGWRSVLVFVKRKVDADRLARAVTRGAAPATSIHSDRRQEDRVAALEAFRRGEYPVMIATDVAARGIDVEGISHVVNFDVPFSPDDYIHRGGRTARAGAVGEVLTFVAPEEEDELQAIEKAIGMTLPRVILPNFDHGVHEHVPRPVVEDGRGRGGRGSNSRGRGRTGRTPRSASAAASPAAASAAVATPSPAASSSAAASDAPRAEGAADAGEAAPAKRRRRRRRRPGSSPGAAAE
jgi:ATP-dependent RNA helicase RhlE